MANEKTNPQVEEEVKIDSSTQPTEQKVEEQNVGEQEIKEQQVEEQTSEEFVAEEIVTEDIIEPENVQPEESPTPDPANTKEPPTETTEPPMEKKELTKEDLLLQIIELKEREINLLKENAKLQSQAQPQQPASADLEKKEGEDKKPEDDDKKPEEETKTKKKGFLKKKTLLKIGIPVVLVAVILAKLIPTAVNMANDSDAANVPPSSYQDPIIPGTPTGPNSPETSSVSLSQFVSEHKTEALRFAKDSFSKLNINGERLAYSFELNENGEISVVKAESVIQETGKNSIVIEKMALMTPISIEDAIARNYENFTPGGLYSKNAIESFNANENYFNSNLRNAFASACNLTGKEVYYNETTTTSQNKREFKVSHISNGVILVYKVSVSEANSDEELIANLQNKNKFSNVLITKTNIGDYKVVDKEYSLSSAKPATYEELKTYYNNDLQTALNDVFFPILKEKCFSSDFDKSELISPQWRILHNDKAITGFQFITNFKTYNDDEQYRIINITLARAINADAFVGENATQTITTQANKAVYSVDFAYNFAPSTQGSRTELMSAIFQKCGMSATASQGAERLFMDLGSAQDANIGQVRQFMIMEKDEERALSYTVYIKSSDSDESYISRLQNSSYYIVRPGQNVEFEGEEIDCTLVENVSETELDLEY